MKQFILFAATALLWIGIQINTVSIIYAQDSPDYTLEEINVSAKINPLKIMKNAANNFANKYSKNYAAQLLQYRTIACNDKYCEFSAYMGVITLLDFNQNMREFFWNNPANQIRIAPLSVLRSSAFDYNGNELELSAISSGENVLGIENLNIGYNNKPMGNILDIKRSLEVYSPINPKMVANYTYKIKKMFENKKEEQFALIEFETKRECFPDKCRLLGSGSILYNITKRSIESITMTNFVDYYSTFARRNSLIVKQATYPAIKITYQNIHGNIFTKSIALSIDWRKPEHIDDNNDVYAITPNSRRNPFKYNLRETECCLFYNPVNLDKPKIEKLKKYIYNSYREPHKFYAAPYIPQVWQNITFNGINMEKVKKDLCINGITLEQQAAANGLNGYELYLKISPALSISDSEFQKYLNFSKKYHTITKDIIFPLIWEQAPVFQQAF